MNDVASFVVSFPRADFPFLAAAAVVARTGTAWFDLTDRGVCLSAVGNELGLVRQLGATIPNGVSQLPISGFGVAAAELPSVVKKANKEGWTSLDIKVTPKDDTATVKQDRIVLTDGTPPELNLFEGLLDLNDDQLDTMELSLNTHRPSELDSLLSREVETKIHVPAFRECLTLAEKLLLNDSKQEQYQLLEFADGIAHGGSLNLRFFIEVPSLKGINLRLRRSQARPLGELLASFELLQPHHLTTGQQHHIFTDSFTKLYATIPDQRHRHSPTSMSSNRPNTEVRIATKGVKDKIKDSLRKGKGALQSSQVLRARVTDDQPARLLVTTHSWKTGTKINIAGFLRPIRSETTLDLLTELSLVERALTVCNNQLVLQSDSEWLYIRSEGPFTKLTVQIRAFPTEPHRIEAQIRSLSRLL